MMIHIKREVKLALTAIAAIFILIWGISFLKARALFDRNNVFYGIYERVDGLKVSSSVIYRGYSVGQVTNIQFIGERFDRVLVQFTVGKNLEIPTNTIAAIESADLMGSKAINLIPGDALEHAQTGDTLQSQLSLGLMDQLNEQLEPLKQKAENIMVSLDTVLLALQDMFTENASGSIRSSLQSVGRTLDNVEEASGTLNELLSRESDHISEIIENINSLTANLESNNEKISRGMDNIVDISDSLRAANLGNTLRHLDGILAQTDSIMAKINHGQGTLGGAVNDEELYFNLVAISENLNKLLTEFRQDPKRFINLSVFDFGSGKAANESHYGIAIAESSTPLPVNAEPYLSYPELKQIRKNGKYLYLLSARSTLKQAKKDLEKARESFPNAYIVKID